MHDAEKKNENLQTEDKWQCEQSSVKRFGGVACSATHKRVKPISRNAKLTLFLIFVFVAIAEHRTHEVNLERFSSQQDTLRQTFHIIIDVRHWNAYMLRDGAFNLLYISFQCFVFLPEFDYALCAHEYVCVCLYVVFHCQMPVYHPV